MSGPSRSLDRARLLLPAALAFLTVPFAAAPAQAAYDLTGQVRAGQDVALDGDAVVGLGDLGLVLDIGAGFGRFTDRLRADHPEATVVAIDKAPGMLTAVEAPVMVADAQAIPYPDACADAVLAMHMLYHVPDIAKAVAEFRRVLKPGGTLLVSTNIRGDMTEMAELWERVARPVLGPDGFSWNGATRDFDSASAPALLEAEFDSVETFTAAGVVKVPEPGPIMRFLASVQTFTECDDASYAVILAAAERELTRHFAEHETFDFPKTMVFYRCR
ncbi:class I SAM-dependent methyltransferase [Glycomyces sp. TRM65418]|uniref:class I SAM-dependent methyltransferase n=1 Tax=Glycomyces sp. TRM65418 TaxID=2867006 RepID=UPI001CE62ECE|nr:class I SAM-dependent methyltransferase [Glycomyces sp. TRM65418]MCC3763098.1 class I SAM-dependent methyltransferase [Glycomyces sp. TRM65418]QZD57106.1 class I SAM-dependent methyltransferase [Glycomyces sp. TRM65418]